MRKWIGIGAIAVSIASGGIVYNSISYDSNKNTQIESDSDIGSDSDIPKTFVLKPIGAVSGAKIDWSKK